MGIKEILNKFVEDLKTIKKKNILIIVSFLLCILIVIGAGYYLYKNNYSSNYAKLSNLETNEPESVMFSSQEDLPNKKPSEYKIGIPYEKAMKDNKPVIVLFYADWCGYCMRFMPTYQTLSNIYKKEFNFSKVNVEDPVYEKDVMRYAITGFPTVYIVDPKYDNRVYLPNSIFSDLKKLRTEIERYGRIREILDSKK